MAFQAVTAGKQNTEAEECVILRSTTVEWWNVSKIEYSKATETRNAVKSAACKQTAANFVHARAQSHDLLAKITKI